jgi:hypothetical protein
MDGIVKKDYTKKKLQRDISCDQEPIEILNISLFPQRTVINFSMCEAVAVTGNQSLPHVVVV